MEPTPVSIRLTKRDVALRQIEAAISLWVTGGDPVAIHTLTGAANRVVCDLLALNGESTTLFDVTGKTKPEARDYWKSLRAAEDFMKHANEDPPAVMDFNVEATAIYLFDTASGYLRLTQTHNHLLGTFLIRISLLYPWTLTDEGVSSLRKSGAVNDARLSNEEFFAKYLDSST